MKLLDIFLFFSNCYLLFDGHFKIRKMLILVILFSILWLFILCIDPNYFILFFFYKFIYFNWRLIILQYCVGFAIHQHESVMGIHMLGILFNNIFWRCNYVLQLLSGIRRETKRKLNYWRLLLTFQAMMLPWWLRSKESSCNARDPGSILESGRSPGEGNDNPLQYSCLGNPMDRGAWWATLHGVAESQIWLSY